LCKARWRSTRKWPVSRLESEGMLPEALTQRIATQLDCLPLVVRDVSPEKLRRRPTPDTWSALENLAHLARYQHVFLDQRIRRILLEEQPVFSRYRAEEDPEWPRWREMTVAETLTDLRTCRESLLERAVSSSDQALARVGLHPAFGALTVPEWLEFFLIHEAHHLYVAMTRARA